MRYCTLNGGRIGSKGGNNISQTRFSTEHFFINPGCTAFYSGTVRGKCPGNN